LHAAEGIDEKLRRSPFAYFRFINRPFADAVCELYAKSLTTMPTVNLHGDAHLEQYAVAVDGRGLADFDDAAVGPPVVDLLRFATSLALATHGDRLAASRAIGAFLAGYERALDDPTVVGPEPAVAARLRARFAPTTTEWLDGITRHITDPDAAERPGLEAMWTEYVEVMTRQSSDMAPSFLIPKKLGLFRGGIGSAGRWTMLVRVEGPSNADDDDVIVEAKELGAGSLGSCIMGRDRDPMRVILGQARLSGRPQRLLGMGTSNGRPFYTHAWRTHYRELSLADLRDPAEVAEIAHDVGLQLGRGHPNLIADPHAAALRASLKALLARLEPSMPDIADGLAQRVILGFQEFVGRPTPRRAGFDTPAH
jgi:hypothetical protein